MTLPREVRERPCRSHPYTPRKCGRASGPASRDRATLICLASRKNGSRASPGLSARDPSRWRGATRVVAIAAKLPARVGAEAGLLYRLATCEVAGSTPGCPETNRKSPARTAGEKGPIPVGTSGPVMTWRMGVMSVLRSGCTRSAVRLGYGSLPALDHGAERVEYLAVCGLVLGDAGQ